MGNCWGAEEDPNATAVSTTNTGTRDLKAPPTAVPGSNSVPRAQGRQTEGAGRPAALPQSTLGKIIKPNPKIFTFIELKSVTRNFKSDSVLGEGGFGKVYKGWVDEKTLAPSKTGVGIPVAVKKCNADSLQGLKEWKTEINFLGKFCHPNLVRLIGYCMEEKELLLVYEYMPNGSLESHLFQKSVEPPSWGTRIKIVMDAARGLDFLHTSENIVIYRDFKAANILLDKEYGAKLSDFGLARIGPPIDKSHVTTQAVGTYGYAAPEYINTGHLYVRSDVYGFGVVLLEILTGLRAYDIDRPSAQISLVDWYKPMLSDKPKLKKIIDPRMNEYPPEGVNKLAQLILRCLQSDPKNRPPMSEVLLILERICTIRMTPNLKGSGPTGSSQPQAQQKRPSRPNSGGVGGSGSARPNSGAVGGSGSTRTQGS